MPTLSHGSDLTLAPTLRPVVALAGGSVRGAFTAIAEAGFRSVQLDAAIPGIRPRELDTSARRDLAAAAGRAGLGLAGIDLFIPLEHFKDPATTDRAAEALIAAVALAADLGRLPLSIALPVGEADAGLIEGLLLAADTHGVPIAMHHEFELDALTGWLAQRDTRNVGLAIDPAALLAARRDPVALTQQLADRLRVARLSDTRAGQADSTRLPVGAGDLDVSGYRVSVDLAPRRIGPVVLDLRQLSDPAAGMTRGQAAWENAAVSF